MKQRYTEISKTLRPPQAWVESRRGRPCDEQTTARRAETLTRQPKIRAKNDNSVKQQGVRNFSAKMRALDGVGSPPIEQVEGDRSGVRWSGVLAVGACEMISPACGGPGFWFPVRGEAIGPACGGLGFCSRAEGETIGPACGGPGFWRLAEAK